MFSRALYTLHTVFLFEDQNLYMLLTFPLIKKKKRQPSENVHGLGMYYSKNSKETTLSGIGLLFFCFEILWDLYVSQAFVRTALWTAVFEAEIDCGHIHEQVKMAVTLSSDLWLRVSVRGRNGKCCRRAQNGQEELRLREEEKNLRYPGGSGCFLFEKAHAFWVLVFSYCKKGYLDLHNL